MFPSVRFSVLSENCIAYRATTFSIEFITITEMNLSEYISQTCVRSTGPNWKGGDNGNPSARLKDHYSQSHTSDPNANRDRAVEFHTRTKQKVIASRGFLANSNE